MYRWVCATLGLAWATGAWAQPNRDELLEGYRRLHASWTELAVTRIDGRAAYEWLDLALGRLDRTSEDEADEELQRIRGAAQELVGLLEPILVDLARVRRRSSIALSEAYAIHDNSPLRYPSRIGDLARIALLAGVHAADQGRNAEACDYYMQAMRLGLDLDRDAHLVSRIVAVNSDARLVPHLGRLLGRSGTADQCRTVVTEVGLRLQFRSPTRETVAVARRMARNTIELLGGELGVGLVAREGLAGAEELRLWMDSDECFRAAQAVAFGHSALLHDAYERAVVGDSMAEARAAEAAIGDARETWVAEARREALGWRDEIAAAGGALAPERTVAIKARIVEILGVTIAFSTTHPFVSISQKLREGRAWLELVRVAAALRVYHLERKVFPETLEGPEMAAWLAGVFQANNGPVEGPSVGRDPETGRVLRYRREGEGYRLWAVGPDGRDHRGWTWGWGDDLGDLVIVGRSR